MKTVREILKKKGADVYSISPESPVFEALSLMSDKNIGALLVMQDGKIEGILSERDYAREVILKGKTSKDLPVKEIMSDKVLYVSKENTPEECMALMTGKRIRHLPVLENDQLAGIISIGDIIKAVIDEREFTIDQLVQYITDRPNILETSRKENFV